MDALSAIRDDGGHLYPQDRIAGCRTALCLFAAAFKGRQDCVWIADNGIAATAVDSDQEALDAMRPFYPSTWSFDHGDAFDYAARRYAEGATYDLVNLDPPTNLFDETVEALELWTGLADKVVVVGHGRAQLEKMVTPAGWEETAWILRSTRHGTMWTTLEPCR